MSKTKSKKKRKANAKAKPRTKPTQEQQGDNPYRPGTLYAALFTEGSKDYIKRDELIAKVAEVTGKSPKVVGFAYAVLRSERHKSNGGRSAELREGDRVKLDGSLMG